VGVAFMDVGVAVSEKQKVAVVEPVVQADGKFPVVRAKWKDAAVPGEQIPRALRAGEGGAQRHGSGGGKAVENSVLRDGGFENGGICQDRYRGGLIADQALQAGKQERAVLPQRCSQAAAELLAFRGRLGADEAAIMEDAGERVAGIQAVMAEKTKQGAVHPVGAGAGDDVDDAAAGAAQLGRVVAAVDLEFLHGLLTDGRANTAEAVVDLASVYRPG